MPPLLQHLCARLLVDASNRKEEPIIEMMRIGLDPAKNVFEVYGVDEKEQQALSKTLKRSQVMKFFA